MAKLKSTADILKMREAGQLAARTLRYLEPFVRAGVTTEELNTISHEFILSFGAIPTPLGYMGYPKSVCTSVNEVICHGIPSPQIVLKDGDIINIDVTVTLSGYVGDTSKTFFVGKDIPRERRHVTEVSAECLAQALAAVRHGASVGDIGAAIQRHAQAQGCSVVREFSGHGLGRVMHEPPEIPHFGTAGSGEKLVRGMTFTIEPMINGGSWHRKVLADGWTAITIDGKPSAQFEHSLALVGDGIEVLTALPDDPILQRARELGATVLWPTA
jgi:methionyl aminopeptidase